MRALSVCSAAVLLAIHFPAILPAQPALERLERQLRDTPVAAPREPGYLGIITRDVPPPGSYIEIRELVPGGPAEHSGLRAGDLIIRVGNETARRMEDLSTILNRSAAGDRLEFTILRGQDEHRFVVTLTRRPPPGARKFDQFGEIRPNLGANPLELPAPAARAVEKQAVPPEDEGPAIIPPGEPIRRSGAESRIDLLERRIAELERRLAELEQLLRRP